MSASPITDADFAPVIFGGDACQSFINLMATGEKVGTFLEWLLDPTTKEISTNALTTIINMLVPVGSMKFWPAAAAPATGDWLVCDGTAISRTTYATLYALIGTSFGAGDGTTTFNLPDMRSKFAYGIPSAGTIGATGGASTVTLITNQSPLDGHTHYYGKPVGTNDDLSLSILPLAAGVIDYKPAPGGSYSAITITGADASGNPPQSFVASASTVSLITLTPNVVDPVATQPHENMPPYLTLQMVIKAK